MLPKNYAYFLAIASKRNISKASKDLYISQPSLSKYLILLEKELGAKLFDRSTMPMQLTPSGECYLKFINDGIEQERIMRDKLNEIQSGLRATVRIGVGIWHSSAMMPRLLILLHQRYPQIKIQLMEASSRLCERALENGEVDLIIHNPIEARPNFAYQTIMKESIVLALNKQLPEARHFLSLSSEDQLSYHANPTDLNGETVVLYHPGQHMEQLTGLYLKKHQITPSFTWSSSNVNTILQLVARTPCYSFVSSLAQKDFHSDSVVFVPLDDPMMHWELIAAYQRRSYIPKAHQIVIDLMQELYSN